MSTVAANVLKSLAPSTSPPDVQRGDGAIVGWFARAWVNFNGTGTPAIRAAGNVSSITDNGQGDYTVNFTSPFADSSYSVAGSAGTVTSVSTNRTAIELSALAAGSARIKVNSDGAGYVDVDGVTVVVFR